MVACKLFYLYCQLGNGMLYSISNPRIIELITPSGRYSIRNAHSRRSLLLDTLLRIREMEEPAQFPRRI